MSDRMNRNPLHYAIVDGELEAAKELIASNQDYLLQKDVDGYTALHFAVQYKHVELVRLLIENGADVNAEDAWGNTPLLRALGPSVESKRLIDILLEAGVDPFKENKAGNSVIGHVRKIKSHPNRKDFEKFL